MNEQRQRVLMWALVMSLQTAITGALLVHVLLGNSITLGSRFRSTPAAVVLELGNPIPLTFLILLTAMSGRWAISNWYAALKKPNSNQREQRSRR